MQTEYEVKILGIHVESIIDTLNRLGAQKIKEKDQKRYVYDFTPKKENSWIRLRTDGQITTLTIKEIQDNTIQGTKEIEITVGDFQTTHLLLQKLGYTHKSYQENKRISYTLDGVHIEIDFWPHIPPYLEIEGSSEQEVENIVRRLGYTINQTTSINTADIYTQYGINVNTTKILKF